MIPTKPNTKPTRTITLLEIEKPKKSFLKIEFPFDKNDLALVKAIPNRKYYDRGGNKYWVVPLVYTTIELLLKHGFIADKEIKNLINNKPIPKIGKIPGLKMELFQYQKEDVSKIEYLNGRVLNALEMGLGKSAESLAWLMLHPELRPAIIVCPASLKLNWEKEANMWMTKPNTQVLFGTNIEQKLFGDIIIINYDILHAWVPILIKLKPKVLVMDEIHLIKANKARRTKASKKLAKNVKHILALSGTPVVNRPVEMYNALRIVDKDSVPTFWEYTKRYCAAKHTGFGWDFSGASNTEELHEILTRSIMIRRLKKDVLLDLPDKIYSMVPMELNNKREYAEAEDNFIDFIKRTKGKQAAEKASGAETLAEIEGLKQLAVQGKMDQVILWIENFLETGEKLIIFAVHKFVIDILMEKFDGIAVKIDGSVATKNRQKPVDAFQNDPKIKLFVGNIQAAGVGITLTASSNVGFIELPWSPSLLDQAADRAHRIGQKFSVTIYYLLAADTIEEKIADMLDKKRKILDAIIDGKVTENESLLKELINTYTK